MKQLFTTYIRRVTIMLLVTLVAPLGLMAQEGSENGSDATMIYAKMGEMKNVFVNNQIQSIELADPTLAQTVNNGTTFVIYPVHAGETQVTVTALVRKGEKGEGGADGGGVIGGDGGVGGGEDGSGQSDYEEMVINYQLSIEKGQPSMMSFNQRQVTLQFGEEFVPPTVTLMLWDLNEQMRYTQVPVENPVITYTSDDTTIAEVDETTGMVTPKKEGRVIIKAHWAGNDDYYPFECQYILIIQKQKPVILFEGQTNPSQTLRFSAIIGNPFEGPKAISTPELTIRYATNNPQIADVDSISGDVMLKGAGMAIITASTKETDEWGEASVSYYLSVEKQRITMQFAQQTYEAFEGTTFNAPEIISNAANIADAVTWNMQCPQYIAVIDENTGTITVNSYDPNWESIHVMAYVKDHPAYSDCGASYTLNIKKAMTNPVIFKGVTFQVELMSDTLTCRLVSPSGYDDVIEFPETIEWNGCTRTVVSGEAINCTMKKLILPKTFQFLKEFSFAGCTSLTDIYANMEDDYLDSSNYPGGVFSVKYGEWKPDAMAGYRTIYNQANLHVPFGNLGAYTYYNSCWYFFPSNKKWEGVGEQTLQTPVFSHEAGTYDDMFELTLTNPNTTGKIYYILSDEYPKVIHEYTEPIIIRRACNVRAYINDGEGNISPVITNFYEMDGYFLINGMPATDKNKDDVLHDGGSVKFDPETFTLTLTNADIEDIQSGSREEVFTAKTITFILKGDNKMMYANIDNQSVDPTEACVIIKGDGKNLSSLNVLDMFSPYLGSLIVEDCSFTTRMLSMKLGMGKLIVKNAFFNVGMQGGHGHHSLSGFTDLVTEGCELIFPEGAQFLGKTEQMSEYGEVPNFYTADADLDAFQTLFVQGEDGSFDWDAINTFIEAYAVSKVVIGEPGEYTPKAPDFNLMIAEEMMDDNNATNFKPTYYDGLQRGKISYDRTTNTLTLNNVVFDNPECYSFIRGDFFKGAFTIKVIGENHVRAGELLNIFPANRWMWDEENKKFTDGSEVATIVFVGGSKNAKLTFEGSENSFNAIMSDGANLVFDNLYTAVYGAQCAVTGNASQSGYPVTLTITNNAAFEAVFTGETPISDFTSMELGEGISILSSEGAYYDEERSSIVGLTGNDIFIGPAPVEVANIEFIHEGTITNDMSLTYKVTEAFTSPSLEVQPAGVPLVWRTKINEKPQGEYAPIKVEVQTNPFEVKLLNAAEGTGQTDVTVVVFDEAMTATATLNISFYADEYVEPEIPNVEAEKVEVVKNFADSGNITEETDLSNTEVDNTLFTLNDEAGDGFDSEDQSIVLNSTMSTEEVEAVLEQLQPGTGAFAAMFSGMTFMLPAGSGHIEVDFLTMGDRVINVKIGDQATAKFSQSAKGTVSIDYYCIEDTYVYIFGSAEASDARPVNYASVFRACAPRKASANADAVKIYGYTITPEETVTGIRSIDKEQLTTKNWYDMSGRKLNGKPTAKGIYILSGKVVVVK